MDIRIEFVSSNILGGMDSKRRVDYLIDVIKKGYIIVLEERLDREDEKLLLEKTMGLIDDRFTGIEISSLGEYKEDWRNTIIRMLGGKTGGMTVIGPAKLIKAIKNEKDKINLLAGLRGE
ncbi:MAG: OapB/ArvB family protein [Candidatus Micrarchaeia archaeon]